MSAGGEFWEALAGDVEEFVAVLGQQVEGVDDVGDVACVCLFEAQAVKCFEQVAGGAQALVGSIEQFVMTGVGVDEQNRVFAVASFERAIAVLHEVRPVFSGDANYRGVLPGVAIQRKWTGFVGDLLALWLFAYVYPEAFFSKSPRSRISYVFVRRNAAILCMVRARICRTFRKRLFNA